MRTPRTRTRAAAIASLVAVVAALTVVAASAEAPRVYALTASPSALAPDTPTTVTFTITNLTPQPISLGSANIYIPAGVTVAGQSGAIALRNLGIGSGGSASFSYTVSAPCSASLYVWGAEAKQANDFNGDGNGFALAGGLPATSVPCPGGPTTTTVAGPGEPTTTTTTTTVVPGPRPNYTTTWDIIEPCLGSSCETEPLEFGNTIGQVFGDDSASVLFLSLRSSDEVPDYCGYDFHPESETVIFDVWGFETEKIVEVTILGIGEDEAFEAEDFEVCFGGEEPFTQKDDRGPAFFGDGLYFGLIPDCEDDDGEGWPGPEFAFWDDDFALGDGNYGPAPCVAWRDLDEDTGDLTVIVLAPPGDPRIKLG
jgi:hypothetical protein